MGKLKKSVKKDKQSKDYVKFISLFVLVIILSLSFVYAAYVVSNRLTGTKIFATQNRSVTRSYNITINNTWTDGVTNVTAVNITIPSCFSRSSVGHGTSAPNISFSNTSDVISWGNGTHGLISIGPRFNVSSFWFNATAVCVGNQTISVTVWNTTTSSSYSLYVFINDLTNISYGDFTPGDYSNTTNRSFYVNASLRMRDALGGNITFLLYNSTGQVNKTVYDAISFIDFINWTNSTYTSGSTGLMDGTYKYNITINDSYGNSSTTATRTLTVDNTNPLIPYASDRIANNSNLSRTSIYINVSITEANPQYTHYTLYYYNGTLANSTIYPGSRNWINWTNLPNSENYTYNVTINDTTGHVNKTVIKTYITLDTTPPTVNHNCSSSSVNMEDKINCACTGNDTWDDNPTVSYTSNPSTDTEGTFTTTCTVTDFAGNIATSSSQYTVTYGGGGGNGGGNGGNGDGGFDDWDNTYIENTEDFTEVKEITQPLMAKERVRIKIGNTNHDVGVTQLTETTATIQITSVPQTATLNIGDTRKFDVTEDGYYDLSVTLNKIESSKADLTIESIYEQVTEEEAMTEEEKQREAVAQREQEEEEAAAATKRKMWMWIIIGVVAVLLVLVGVGYGVKKKRK